LYAGRFLPDACICAYRSRSTAPLICRPRWTTWP